MNACICHGVESLSDYLQHEHAHLLTHRFQITMYHTSLFQYDECVEQLFDECTDEVARETAELVLFDLETRHTQACDMNEQKMTHA